MYKLIINPVGMNYGVQVGNTVIPSITTSYAEAAVIVATLKHYEVSEIHALDIIDDWLVMREDWDIPAKAQEYVSVL